MSVLGRDGGVTADLRRLHRLLVTAAGVLVALAGLGLAFGWVWTTRVAPDWPEIFPYTVAGAGALVAALALLDLGRRPWAAVARLLAVVTLLLGAGVDLLVAAGVLPSSDPTTSTAATWVTALPSLATIALSGSILLIDLGGEAIARLRFWLAAAAGLVPLLTLLSYLYGSTALFTGLGLTGTSMPTALIGTLIAAAAMTARPGQPPLVALDRNYDIGLMRLVLPMMVLVVFVPALSRWLIGLVDDDAASAAALGQLVTVLLLVTVVAVAGGGVSRARRAVIGERRRVWDAFEHTPAATAVIATSGRIVDANAAFARLTGETRDALIGRSLAGLIAADDRAAVESGVSGVLVGRDQFRADVRLAGPDRRTGDSSPTWIELGIAPVRNARGDVATLIAQCGDLTDRKRLERVLSDRATRDPLSGLLNREGFEHQLAARLTHADPDHVPTVVYADVDGLKPLNDELGHAAGDDLLREVGRRLRSSTRSEDIVARLGGDEFVVVTSLPVHSPEAGPLVQRLRDTLNGPIEVDGNVVNLSVSLGAAVLTEGDIADALSRADMAMYRDKHRRRGGPADRDVTHPSAGRD